MKYFFIKSPANVITGGVELLHQLVYKLNKNKNIKAIIYYDILSLKTALHPTPELYMKYTKGEFVIEVIDDLNNVIVLPEIYSKDILSYKNIKIVFWWLSVDNFFKSIGVKQNYKEYKKGKKYNMYKFIYYIGFDPISFYKPFRTILFSNKVFLHVYQSKYAHLFLIKNRIKNILPLSDYLNNTYLENRTNIKNRENVILYNPKKGIEITSKLINYMNDYNWIPLEKFSPLEMKNIMLKSKVYVDFGNHPGKDRIPREAAICGCVVITNKFGAAQNNFDIPINEEFKFKNPLEEKERFKYLINNIFKDFEMYFQRFNFYRDKIKNEEKLFEKELKNFINYFEN